MGTDYAVIATLVLLFNRVVNFVASIEKSLMVDTGLRSGMTDGK